jgi:hypothetical protein
MGDGIVCGHAEQYFLGGEPARVADAIRAQRGDIDPGEQPEAMKFRPRARIRRARSRARTRAARGMSRRARARAQRAAGACQGFLEGRAGAAGSAYGGPPVGRDRAEVTGEFYFGKLLERADLRAEGAARCGVGVAFDAKGPR